MTRVALVALLFACGPRPEARDARAVADAYPQRTPEEALRSFVRAAEREDWNVMLHFTPQRYRAALTAEKLAARWRGRDRDERLAELARVRAHLAEPLALGKDEARLPLDERRQVKLVREGDGWKVESLE